MVDERVAEAQKLERKAKRLREKSGRYLTGPTHGEVAEVYEKAGDTWYKLRRYPKALIDYDLAIEHAYDESIKKKIRKKMEEIDRMERTKYKEGIRKLKAKGLKIRKLKIIGLEKRLAFGILSIVSLVASLFFISLNITGYTIKVFDNARTFLLMGAILFILGLIFAFFYFRRKRK